MNNIKIVIPARYASSRLYGKPLLMLAGKPMIQHSYERAVDADLGEIVIATDDQRIFDVCVGFGATVCMTKETHQTGSDRLSEVVEKYSWDDNTIIVNLQGDEPLTPISCLQQVAANLAKNNEASIATLATPIQSDAEYNNPNAVKVVFDRNGYALYFSRAAIPYQRDENQENDDFAYRHLGIYAYRAGFLKDFVKMDACPIEQLEKLEQLRAMWNGKRIHVAVAEDVPGHGVDTKEDLLVVEKILSRGILKPKL